MAPGSLRPWRERPVQAGDTELFVREWGEERSPPLLFWHALGDHTGLQVAEAARILAADFGLRVIAFDAPGFGESPPVATPDSYALGQLAALVVSAAGALGVERPVLAGSSWGGSVGLAAAATAPASFRGVALLDSGYQSGFEGDESLAELRRFWREQPGFRFASWAEWEDDARDAFRRWTPELAELLRAGFREEGTEVVSRLGPDAYATIIWTLRRESWTAFIPGAGAGGVPVLLLAATEPPDREERRAADLERFAELVPQARIVRVAEAGHPLLEEQPELVARTVGAWAERLYA